jgi:hypothetical protein
MIGSRVAELQRTIAERMIEREISKRDVRVAVLEDMLGPLLRLSRAELRIKCYQNATE